MADDVRISKWSLTASAGMTTRLQFTAPTPLTSLAVYTGGTVDDVDDLTDATAFAGALSGGDLIATVDLVVAAEAGSEPLRLVVNGAVQSVGSLHRSMRGVESPDNTITLTADETAYTLEILGVIVQESGGGTVADGDKGDITVSGSGAVWTLDSGAAALTPLSAAIAAVQAQANQTDIDVVALGDALALLEIVVDGKLSKGNRIDVSDFPTVEDSFTALLANPGWQWYCPPGDYDLTDMVSVPAGSDVDMAGATFHCQAAGSGIRVDQSSEQIIRLPKIDAELVALEPLRIGIGQIDVGGGSSKCVFDKIQVENCPAGSAPFVINHLQNSLFVYWRVGASDNAPFGLKLDEGSKNNSFLYSAASRLDGPGLWLTTSDASLDSSPQRTSKNTFLTGLFERCHGIRVGDAEEQSFINVTVNANPSAPALHAAAYTLLADGNRGGVAHGPDGTYLKDSQLKSWDTGVFINGPWELRTDMMSYAGCLVGVTVNNVNARVEENSRNVQEAATRFVGTGGATEAVCVKHSPHERIDAITSGTTDITVPDDPYDVTTWNNNAEVPTKNAVRDKFVALLSGLTFTGDVLVPADAYNASTWNNNAAVPTKDAVRDKIESIPLVGSTSDIEPDVVTTPGSILWNLAANPSTNALDLQGHVKITSARLATIVALPACTYSNGSSGVGATLTGNAVGALADIDFRTPVANDIILVKNQASALQNGIYKVTTLGSGGAAFVLTRIAEADVAADYVDGVFCFVADGELYRGSTWQAAGTIMIGTTSIVWRSVGLNAFAGPGPLKSGMSRDRRYYDDDFEELVTTITTSGGIVPGTGQQVFLSGAGAQVTQQHGAAGETTAIGVASLETGTTNAGAAAIVQSRTGATVSSSTRANVSGRWRTPTVATSGVEDFNCWVGLFAVVLGSDPTDCIAIKAPAGGGNYQAVTRSGGTETATDTGIAQATSYRPFRIVVDDVAAAVRFYMSVSGVMTLVATNTTNIPSALMYFGALIDKTAGTTSRTLRLDRLTSDVPEERTAVYMA